MRPTPATRTPAQQKSITLRNPYVRLAQNNPMMKTTPIIMGLVTPYKVRTFGTFLR